MTFSFARFWRGLWQLADVKIWIASTIPMLAAVALAYSADPASLDLLWIVIAFIGIYFIEIGKNAVNEFVDYFTGVDTQITPENRTPFSGGKKTIIDGKLTTTETLFIFISTLSIALIIGICIAYFKEANILWIGVAGTLIAIFYSLPPLRLNYNGWGEVAVATAFGPLLMSGMYVMLIGTLHWQVIAAGVPLGFLITNILWINQYPDYEADQKGGKRNWLVRIGKVKGIRVYTSLYIAAYTSLALLTWVFSSPYWLLGWLSIPLAVQSVLVLRKHYDDIQRLLTANIRTVQIYVLVGLAMIIAALL